MNFAQTDYLQDLNLDFGSPALSDTKNDLDLFSQVDFFDLDVLSNDNVNYVKPNQQQQQQQQQHHIQVKQEESEISQLFKIPELANALNMRVPVQVLTPPSLSSTPAPSYSSDPNSRSPFSDSGNERPVVVTEDKRKRNTEASARFRIKKKQKEQDMERRSKDLRERVGGLEKKLKTLEMENKCLKQLILQQNEQKNTDLLENIKKRSILESRSVFAYTK